MLTKKVILNENKLLNKKITELTKQNNELKEKLQQLQNNMGYEICEYFNDCKSLEKTTEHFCFENISKCYYSLAEYNDCSDTPQSAIDYKKYHKEIFGYEYDENVNNEDNNNEDDEDDNKVDEK